MKKLIILAVTIIVIASAAIAAYLYYASFHKVSIVFGTDVTGATLYKATEEHSQEGEGNHGEELQKFTTNSETSLQDGEYFVIPDGEKVAKDEIHFTVEGKDTTVELRPGFSSEYLKKVLLAEEVKTTAALNAKFPTVMKDYTIAKGALYEQGDWYGALLVRKVSDLSDQRDVYRTILHKENGVWKVVHQPEIVLTSAVFKDAPIEMLRTVNELTP